MIRTQWKALPWNIPEHTPRRKDLASARTSFCEGTVDHKHGDWVRSATLLLNTQSGAF